MKIVPKSCNILSLSGWAQDSEFIKISDPIFNITPADYHLFSSKTDFINNFNKEFTNPDIVIGWSLGGQIALDLILKKLINPKLLILIKTPIQFLSSQNFAFGMDEEKYNDFKFNLKINQSRALKKFQLMIQYGSENSNIIEQTYLKRNLQYWLNQLASNSFLDTDVTNLCETHLYYDKSDIIVDYRQGEIFNKKIKNSKLVILNKTGHLPHFLCKLIDL